MPAYRLDWTVMYISTDLSPNCQFIPPTLQISFFIVAEETETGMDSFPS